jgi:hypothetical protein
MAHLRELLAHDPEALLHGLLTAAPALAGPGAAGAADADPAAALRGAAAAAVAHLVEARRLEAAAAEADTTASTAGAEGPAPAPAPKNVCKACSPAAYQWLAWASPRLGSTQRPTWTQVE